MENAHSIAATAGDTEVYNMCTLLSSLFKICEYYSF